MLYGEYKLSSHCVLLHCSAGRLDQLDEEESPLHMSSHKSVEDKSDAVLAYLPETTGGGVSLRIM